MAGNDTVWLGAEATVNGRPMLVRSRNPLGTEFDPTRPHLLVVDFSYSIRDDVQLPSDDDYDLISAFEARAFDTKEVVADPELVFVETGSGVVRYYCYTSDLDRAMGAIEEASKDLDALVFSSAEDPQWLIYQGRAAQLRLA